MRFEDIFKTLGSLELSRLYELYSEEQKRVGKRPKPKDFVLWVEERFN